MQPLNVSIYLRAIAKIVILLQITLTTTFTFKSSYVSAALLQNFGSANSAVTVFRHAQILTMEDDKVRSGWSVVVQGDRIVEVGPDSVVIVPEGATVLDVRGQYLLPGLFDAHAHLDPEVGARPNFGEAPLYLAFGVTSVVSMKGDSTYLALRELVAGGNLLAPNLYTSAPFVDEPLINNPGEAAAFVEEQKRAGYDLIKLHEVYEYNNLYHFMGGITYLTSEGIDQPTLSALANSARTMEMPAAGHIPPRLGLEGMLEAGMSLAHSSILLGGYFWPTQTVAFERNTNILKWGMALLFGALVIFLLGGAVSLIRRRAISVSWMAALGAATIVGTVFMAQRILASYLWLGNEWRVLGWTVVGVIFVGIAIALAIDAIKSFRRSRPLPHRAQSLFGSSGALLVGMVVITFWVPVLNRSTNSGLASMAQKIADAGLWVQTTLSVEDTLVLRDIPELDYLDPRKAAGNRRWAARWSEERKDRVRRGIPFFESVAKALHEQGVPLLLGTDAMGFPLIVPGVSVHDEMRLLNDAGLSPYEVLQTATVNPSRFLGIEEEVGTIEIGKRADLLLVDQNPLLDLTTLRNPDGVMVRGRWLNREKLQTALKQLADEPPPLAALLAEWIESEGINAAAARFRERLAEGRDPTLGPNELNSLGYDYYRRGKPQTTVRIFELNTEAFPEAPNPWDSLGEIYLEVGEKDRAIRSYLKSLELNPGNKNARKVLRDRLGVEVEN